MLSIRTPNYFANSCAIHSLLNKQDRPDITSQIYQYMVSDSNLPLVVHGITGSGKTSLMAGVAYHVKEKYPLTRMILVIRFIGITPGSFNIRCTLRSICEQVSVSGVTVT